MACKLGWFDCNCVVESLCRESVQRVCVESLCGDVLRPVLQLIWSAT